MIHIPQLSILHWILAYAGLAISVLYKLSMSDQTLTKEQKRKERYTTISSVIAIPVIMILSQEPAVKEMIPITNITAFFVGSQTQGFLRILNKFNKFKKEQDE